jgi:hypothetical protein
LFGTHFIVAFLYSVEPNSPEISRRKSWSYRRCCVRRRCSCSLSKSKIDSWGSADWRRRENSNEQFGIYFGVRFKAGLNTLHQEHIFI